MKGIKFEMESKFVADKSQMQQKRGGPGGRLFVCGGWVDYFTILVALPPLTTM